MAEIREADLHGDELDHGHRRMLLAVVDRLQRELDLIHDAERSTSASLAEDVRRFTAERDTALAVERDHLLEIGLSEPRPIVAGRRHPDGDLIYPGDTTPGPVVICGSTSQLDDLAAAAAPYQAQGREVLVPTASDRPAADLDREWMEAIPRASLVVVVRKPDGSVGAQTFVEVVRAYECGVPVRPMTPVPPPAVLGVRCPDQAACFHQCAEFGYCYRVRNCMPMSGVFPGDRWPMTVPAPDAVTTPSRVAKP